MNRLWKYEDYVSHLSHENEMVRQWAFDGLDHRFRNRYTDEIATMIDDENDHTVCLALGYLSHHKAVQHAPAILERFKHGHGMIAGNCAIALGQMRYAPAMETMLAAIGTTRDVEAFAGVLSYLGSLRTEAGRSALVSVVSGIKDDFLLGAACAALVRHCNPEDIDPVLKRCFKSGKRFGRQDMPLKDILSPLGGASYFADFTEYGSNDILSKPSRVMDDFVDKNAHLTVDEDFLDDLVLLLEERQLQEVAAAVLLNAGDVIHARYGENEPSDGDGPRELFEQDTMCLRLVEHLSKESRLWRRNESSDVSGRDLVAFILSAWFAIMERGAYVRALQPKAGVEAHIAALHNSGPSLPDRIQDRICALAPIAELKASLSKDLLAWGDIWTVRLMGRIGDKAFVPDLLRVLREADSLDYIFNDALNAIGRLDEAAEEDLLAAVRSGEVDDWSCFALLEHLPYAEAHELAIERWDHPGENAMDSYEMFAICLRNIGDRRAIEKLQGIYADENDAGYIGDTLECLSGLHGVELPEMADIVENRKELISRQKARMKLFNDMTGYCDTQDSEGGTSRTGGIVPFKRQSPKIGRNAPCPCGSGKKYKKCCLNK